MKWRLRLVPKISVVLRVPLPAGEAPVKFSATWGMSIWTLGTLS